jgi:mannose-6-phosphate isomerase-like protein (cupin superfamily)
MAQTIHQAETKPLHAAADKRTFPNGKLEIVEIAGTEFARATMQPGWKWSESVKPIAGTESCEVPHLGYVVSGRMTVAMNDGTRLQLRGGDAVSIPPGHEAWVEGNEPFVMIDFAGSSDYAKPHR